MKYFKINDFMRPPLTDIPLNHPPTFYLICKSLLCLIQNRNYIFCFRRAHSIRRELICMGIFFLFSCYLLILNVCQFVTGARNRNLSINTGWVAATPAKPATYHAWDGIIAVRAFKTAVNWNIFRFHNHLQEKVLKFHNSSCRA